MTKSSSGWGVGCFENKKLEILKGTRVTRRGIVCVNCMINCTQIFMN